MNPESAKYGDIAQGSGLPPAPAPPSPGAEQMSPSVPSTAPMCPHCEPIAQGSGVIPDYYSGVPVEIVQVADEEVSTVMDAPVGDLSDPQNNPTPAPRYSGN